MPPRAGVSAVRQRERTIRISPLPLTRKRIRFAIAAHHLEVGAAAPLREFRPDAPPLVQGTWRHAGENELKTGRLTKLLQRLRFRQPRRGLHERREALRPVRRVAVQQRLPVKDRPEHRGGVKPRQRRLPPRDRHLDRRALLLAQRA